MSHPHTFTWLKTSYEDRAVAVVTVILSCADYDASDDPTETARAMALSCVSDQEERERAASCPQGVSICEALRRDLSDGAPCWVHAPPDAPGVSYAFVTLE